MDWLTNQWNNGIDNGMAAIGGKIGNSPQNSSIAYASGLSNDGAPTVHNYNNGFLGIGNNSNQVKQEQNAYNNWFNDAEMQKNREWEAEMSNTAVQRRMADLKAAHINPVLAAGSAASSPSTSSVQAGNYEPKAQTQLLDFIEKLISSAAKVAAAAA